MRFPTIFLFAFFIICSADAQDIPLREDFVKAFPVFSTNISWSKLYHGYLDGDTEVEMYLAKDQKEYKGLYRYISSGLTFHLEGSYDQDGLLYLKEIDSLFRVTGYMVGDFEKEKFEGEWRDYAQIHSLPVNVSEQLDTTYEQNTNNWYMYLSGIRYPEIRFLVEKKHENVSAFFHFGGDLLEASLSLIPGRKNLYTGTYSNLNDETKEIFLSLNPELAYFETTDSLDRKVSFRLNSEAILPLATKDFTVYTTRMTALTPTVQTKNFNLWLDTKIAYWWEDQLSRAKLYNTHMEDFSHSERFIKGANIDVIMDLVTTSLISGRFILQSSFTDTIHEIPFIYHISKDKEVSLAELYPKKTDIELIIQHIISGRIVYQKIPSDEVSKPYVFPTLSHFGLSIRTAFDPIDGQDQMIINSRDVLPMMNKNNIIKKSGIWQ